MKETSIQNRIRLEAVALDCTLFRNNIGMLRDERGNCITYGLAVGSSDLIGFTCIEGRAIFTAVEVKVPGKRPTIAQAAFIAAVKSAGGIACVAYGIEDVQRAIAEWRLEHL